MQNDIDIEPSRNDSWTHANKNLSLYVEQMWIQDDYTFSIQNVEFYHLGNSNTIHNHTNRPNPNVCIFKEWT